VASHIDLDTSVVTVDPQAWDPDQADLGVVEGTVNPIEKVPVGAEGMAIRRRRALWTHEIVHFWQCLWLPYLYYHTTYAWHSLSAQFSALRERRQPFDWRAEPMPPVGEVWEGISRDRTYRNSAGKVSPPLSPLRLMENAASLFQYEVFLGIDTPPSADGYDEWATSNPAYLDAYDFVADLLGRYAAFHLLPSLIAAAFHTTAPVRTFLRLATTMSSAVARRLAPQSRSSIRAILINMLAQYYNFLSFEPGSAYDPSQVYLLRQGRFDPSIEHHPIFSQYRKLWFEDIVADPELAGLFIEFPWGVYVYRTAHWRRLINHYRPPVILVLNSAAPSVLVTPGPLRPGQVRELLDHHASFRAFDILRGGKAAARHPTCRCTNCRFWPTGLCQGVLDPPDPGPAPEERCWFPSLLARHGARMSDPYRMVIE
jgi:hypothetical protein